MQSRSQHHPELLAFLQDWFPGRRWDFSLPSSGRGHETYIARSNGRIYFVKLGAQIPRYQVMASLGLTPAVIMTGHLEDGTSILVQQHISGWNPSWSDFHQYLEDIAEIVNKMHHSQALKHILPDVPYVQYRDVGLTAVDRVRIRWEQVRCLVPAEANYVDETLAQLKEEAEGFIGSGLIASHNDICNANWILAGDSRIYLVDLEAMSQDDPAHDMGSLLWWYYPPELRLRFLERAGYTFDKTFKKRMRVRMALHCLDITLPRAGSFDRFDASSFDEDLRDFKAAVEGRENPRGYND